MGMSFKKSSRGARGDGNQHSLGYGKPPIATRFQKGTSGNPAGRPKGASNVKTRLHRRLSALMTVRENGRTTRIPVLEALLTKAVKEALTEVDYKPFVTFMRFMKDNDLVLENERIPQQMRVVIKIIRPGDKPDGPPEAPSENNSKQNI